jgi:hypothetical protein
MLRSSIPYAPADAHDLFEAVAAVLDAHTLDSITRSGGSLGCCSRWSATATGSARPSASGCWTK